MRSVSNCTKYVVLRNLTT